MKTETLFHFYAVFRHYHVLHWVWYCDFKAGRKGVNCRRIFRYSGNGNYATSGSIDVVEYFTCVVYPLAHIIKRF